MTSPALQTRRRRGPGLAAAGSLAVAVLLGAGWSRAQAPDGGAVAAAAASHSPSSAAQQGSRPFADRFPNLVLKAHDGRNVRFYDDLLKDKIVLINFMYATCKER